MRYRVRIAGLGLAGCMACGGAAAADAGGIRAISAGARHTVALQRDGSVRAWGDGCHGQLGHGEFAGSERPVAVRGSDGKGRLVGVVGVAAGMLHTFAIHEDGTLWAWGGNRFGQLGNGSSGPEAGRAAPGPVLGPDGAERLRGVRAAAGGWDHSAALLENGTVWAWGSNCQGQLGDGTRDANRWSAHPIQVRRADGQGPLRGITAIACGAFHTVALRDDGTLLAWGSNQDGQLGRGRLGRSSETDNAPHPVAGPDGRGALDNVIAVAAGFYHTVALRADGSAWTWGYNGTGQLGHGTRESTESSGDLQSAVPKRMIAGRQGGEFLRDIAAVAAGYETTYAVDRDGRAWACGWNVYGGLGMGIDPNRAYNRGRMQPVLASGDDGPVQVSGLKSIAAGAFHALALDADGRPLAWGHNGYAQLGDGTRRDRDAPVRTAALAAGFVPDPAPRPRGAAPDSPAVDPHFGEPAADAPGVFNARAHGATGDGVHLDREALQAAIDAAHDAGGGVVLVPAGIYRTGALRLRSRVRLHLARGATLLGSANRDHYEPRAVIHAEDAHDIALTGDGTIDGQGCLNPSRGWRINIIRMTNCRDVTVEGIATVNAGSWTQHYTGCKNLFLRNVRVNCVLPGRNNDGLDFTGCEDVLIEGCTVISDDDAIVIKSTRLEYANRNIRAIGNVASSFASCFKLGTETRGAFTDIVCEGLRAVGGTTLGVYSVDGAEIDGVRIEGVRAESSRCALAVRLGARLRESYFARGEQRRPGALRNVTIKDLDVRMAARPWREVLLELGAADAEMAHQLRVRPVETGFISGLPDRPVDGVLLENIRIRRPGGGPEATAPAEVPERPTAYPASGMFGELPAWGFFLRHARGVALRNVALELESPDARPPLHNQNLAPDDLAVDRLDVRELWRGRGAP